MRLPADILADADVGRVLSALQAAGARVWLVGGAVRNALLGEPVADIDLATDALPAEVTRLAEAAGLRAVPTGIEHGTVTVIAGGRGFEVTTLRRDVETDGRHAVVSFTADLAEDAARRDFTMNALYAAPSGEVIDPVGGLPDLAARRLRFVGEPEARIREDYLRILRFFRFLAQYGREADPAAVAACAALKPGLARIARERIGAEMRKLLAALDPGPAVALMDKTGVLDLLLPRPEPARLCALLEVEWSEATAPHWPRRLAALAGDDAAEALRLSKAEARAQAILRQALAAGWSIDEAGFRLGAEMAVDLALLRAAEGQPLPQGWRARIAQAAGAALPISAADLTGLEGAAIGRGLRAAETAWIASGFAMPAPALIDAARLAAEETT
ncbi:CCA tRNA nucleotidyltransferase [Paracoccus tibetensis]|uniref:Poly(A) polymerase n=1 Tax=Paracoccus tibetensis TaxID=336292 RepID=A0A1G5G8A3_9RHOB|nr:CCA tRNA nucleotidyltransferase [Paracoccus tibetensis]SCY47587.1 poly(A) polymerase [Paracoccus tibetensis]